MSHQLNESWIFEDVLLSDEQARALRMHIADCPECFALHQSWQGARSALRGVEVVAPAPGFSQRWRASLEDRRVSEQKRQVRRFLFFLIGALLLSGLSLAAHYLVLSSPVTLLVTAMQTVAMILICLSHIQDVLQWFLRVIPPAILITTGILLASSLSIFSSVWVATMWWFTTQGVHES